MKPDQPLNLAESFDEHSAEGVAILTSEPSRLMYATVWLMVGLLIAALIWSFIGRANVVVKAAGTLMPESEVRRVFAPIDGELVEVYVTEGLPVAKGDVIARINARDAVKIATEALDAEVKLANAEREYKNFPERKKVLQGKIESLKAKIEAEERRYNKRLEEGISKLAEEQKAKLEEARGQLEKARNLRDMARVEADKYERLFQMAGGGGISRQQVDEKRAAMLSAEADYQVAEAKMNDLSVQLSKGSAQQRKELEESEQTLRELRLEYQTALQDMEREAHEIEVKLKSARLAAESARRISFENIDESNFLKIIAPVSGVITEVAVTQTGDKVQSAKPLASIAPEGARAVVELEIDEKDRAFLREGQTVKLKFNAFPYERYGLISGDLEYVAPAAHAAQDKKLIYKGRASLERDYFMVEGQKHPLRYGMTATAEIVVRKRRIIDRALDPLRSVIR